MEIDLPMPGEGMDADEEEYWEYEDEEEVYDLPEPSSEDERLNGVNIPPPNPYADQFQYPKEDREPRPHVRQQGVRRKRRRMPPMPRVPSPDDVPVFVPPFPVDADGNAVGVPLSVDGAPPIEEIPDAILADGTVEPFDPGRGSLEGVQQIFRGR